MLTTSPDVRPRGLRMGIAAALLVGGAGVACAPPPEEGLPTDERSAMGKQDSGRCHSYTLATRGFADPYVAIGGCVQKRDGSWWRCATPWTAAPWRLLDDLSSCSVRHAYPGRDAAPVTTPPPPPAGSSSTWSCPGLAGTVKAASGDYYLASFGCWRDEAGTPHGDPGDNCVPLCLQQARAAGLCGASESGRQCEQRIGWYTADAGRFGCLQRLRVSEPRSGRAVVAVVLDGGPACWVERLVQKEILDASTPVARHLFGSARGWSDRALVHVIEVGPSTPLGPEM